MELSDYKFVIVSYMSGCKGHYISYKLASLFPEHFCLFDFLPIQLKSKKGNHKFYHNAIPFFFELIHSGYEADINLVDEMKKHKSYSALNENKINIIMTHIYDDVGLYKMKKDIGADVEIIKVVFNDNDIDEFVDRFFDIYAGLTFTGKKEIDYHEFKKYARDNVYKNDCDFFTLEYSKLEDKDYMLERVNKFLVDRFV